MKTIYGISALLMMIFSFQTVEAQDCTNFFPMQENTLLEYTSYDQKDKVEGKNTTKVVEKSVDGEVVEIQVYNTLEDKKGEIISEGTYFMKCEDGKLYVDLSSRFQDVFKPIEDMEENMNVEAEFSGTELIIPNDLSEGQMLPDANIEASINTGPMKLKTFVNITNRRVIGSDRLETAAGIFDCIKISSDIQTKAMGMGFNGQTIEWVAEGVGTIKSESLNKKGKLISYSVLTRIQN